MENETKKEIDLIDALNGAMRGIKSIIKKCAEGLGWVFRLIYQEKVIILAFTIIGILLGAFLSRTKIYRSEVDMQILSHDAFFYKNLIDPMFKQCKYQDYEAISKNFGITEDEAKKIANIQAFFYIDVQIDGTPDRIDYDQIYNPADTNEAVLNSQLRLVVDCNDAKLIAKMDSCFKYFFSNNPLIIKENDIRRMQLKERIDAIEYEISLLDSLRRYEYFAKKREMELKLDKVVMIGEKDAKLYHQEILALNTEKLRLKKDLALFDNGINFSSPFEINPRPVNHWLKICAILGLVFFILGTIIAGFIRKRKLIVNYLEKEI